MDKSPVIQGPDVALTNLSPFWWLFALRGGFAMLFSAVLLYTGTLMGTIFLDPILLVMMGLLIGFFVFGNGVILSVAAVFAAEHHRPVSRLILAESIFAIALGIYIACALFISPRSVALLAGMHAVGTGCFACALAAKLRHDRSYIWLLGISGVVTICIGAMFLLNQHAEVKRTTTYFSGFEVLHGAVFVVLAISLKSALRASALSAVRDLAPLKT